MFTDRDTTLDSSPANIEETVADRGSFTRAEVLTGKERIVR
jgi:hypothetical protein